ncbi:MAG: AAA family ATPase [Eubacteriales bacterium]|nr:AAA family ATPase [Eubacteriales bacterium]
MLERKIEKRMLEFFQEPHHKALLITGARQVGKTYSIRKFGQQNFVSFLEINFLENQSARQLFTQANKAQELLLRLSALVDGPMLPGKTLIFFDEVQECPEIVTAIKFLVEEGSYRYILSGSLLGVGLQDIRSLPVGYMDVWEMFPLDLEEFATSQQVSPQTLAYLNTCYVERRPVDHLVHQQMLNLFHLYLVVGGMPAVVQSYVDTNNLRIVSQEQEAIINWYKQDIGKYDPDNKLYLEAIFQLIPAELNNQNKRFILKNLNENFKFSRYANSFIWLEQAGVALPAYAVNEPA